MKKLILALFSVFIIYLFTLIKPLSKPNAENAPVSESRPTKIETILTKPTSIAATSPKPTSLSLITLNQLDITSGKISVSSGQYSFNTPRIRAVIKNLQPQDILLKFTFLGDSDESIPLESGIMRRQIGLKVAEQNPCNLIFVMWHVFPSTKIQIQEKLNLNKATSAQCGADGYRTLANITENVPQLKPGKPHELEVKLTGEKVTVLVDKKVVWSKVVDSKLLKTKGSAGIRADNVKALFQLFK